MQPVPGLDALKLIPMIVQAANRACMHKKNCKQFAQHLQLIGDLLKEITISKIKRCKAAQKPLELLEEALRKSYRLVTRCQKRNFFFVLVMGWNIENQFREIENEIDRFLNIIPLIHLTDNGRVKELHHQVLHYKEKAERAAAKEKAAAKERARAERAAAKERARAEKAEKAAAEERRRAERAAAERAKRAERAAAEERARARAERAAADERAKRAERAAKERPEKTTAKKRTAAKKK